MSQCLLHQMFPPEPVPSFWESSLLERSAAEFYQNLPGLAGAYSVIVIPIMAIFTLPLLQKAKLPNFIKVPIAWLHTGLIPITSWIFLAEDPTTKMLDLVVAYSAAIGMCATLFVINNFKLWHYVVPILLTVVMQYIVMHWAPPYCKGVAGAWCIGAIVGGWFGGESRDA